MTPGQGLLNLDRLALGDKRVFPIRLYTGQRDLSQWALVSKTHGKDHGPETSNHDLAVSPVLALPRLIVQSETGHGQRWQWAARHCRPYAFYLFYLAAIASPVQLSWRLFDTLEMGWDAALQQVSTASNMGPTEFRKTVPGNDAISQRMQACCSPQFGIAALLSALFIDEHCSWATSIIATASPVAHQTEQRARRPACRSSGSLTCPDPKRATTERGTERSCPDCTMLYLY